MVLFLSFGFHLVQAAVFLVYVVAFTLFCILLHRDFTPPNYAENSAKLADIEQGMHSRRKSSTNTPLVSRFPQEKPWGLYARRAMLLLMAAHCFLSIVFMVDPFAALGIFPVTLCVWLYFPMVVSMFAALDVLMACFMISMASASEMLGARRRSFMFSCLLFTVLATQPPQIIAALLVAIFRTLILTDSIPYSALLVANIVFDISLIIMGVVGYLVAIPLTAKMMLRGMASIRAHMDADQAATVDTAMRRIRRTRNIIVFVGIVGAVWLGYLVLDGFETLSKGGDRPDMLHPATVDSFPAFLAAKNRDKADASTLPASRQLGFFNSLLLNVCCTLCLLVFSWRGGLASLSPSSSNRTTSGCGH